MNILPASAWTPGAEGAFVGLPHKTYLDAPGVSISTLRHIRPTPAHLQHYLATKEDEQPSADMIVGTLVHHALLTPNDPLPHLAIKTADIDYRTKAGKAWRVEQEAAGKIILGEDKMETVRRCVEGAKQVPELVEGIQCSDCEVSIWRTRTVSVVTDYDKRTEVQLLLKCRFDVLPRDWPLCVDLKTTDDASEEEWSRTMLRHEYHRQAAWYLDLLGEDRAWFFAAIEKPTGFVRFTQLKPAAISRGREENERDLTKLAYCTHANNWPAYSIDGSDVCDIPIRAYSQPV